jgi:hypothetical protein
MTPQELNKLVERRQDKVLSLCKFCRVDGLAGVGRWVPFWQRLFFLARS